MTAPGRCPQLSALPSLGIALAVLGACAPRMATDVPDPLSIRVGRSDQGPLFEQALDPVPQTTAERGERLIELFRLAGCPDDEITRSSVMTSRDKNLFCRLPGETENTIVVAAHTHHTGYGIGLSDDWSGLAMLPLLYHALRDSPRQHSFVFAGFGAVTQDSLGAESYLRRMQPFRRSQIAAMVNLKGLGLGSTAVWSSLADPDLRLDLVSVSKSLGLELRHVDLSKQTYRRTPEEMYGWPIHADASRFRRYRIPSIVIHSYDLESASLLANPQREHDRRLFDPRAYSDSLRLISVYLAYLDQTLVIRRERGN